VYIIVKWTLYNSVLTLDERESLASAVFEFQHERPGTCVPNNSTISAGASVPEHMNDGSECYLIIIPSVGVQPSEAPNIEMSPRG